ncbi:MAG: hypothetical protein EB114_11430 [Betaproteobacteria bacterium]|nr:hypothetical protein [Betaproteobacteria bacterium]
MNIQYIKPDELRKVWKHIKPGLETILQKSPEAWIPEDIYSDCFNQRSMLWAFIERNIVLGFVVLQPMGDNLHIWCAFGKGDFDAGLDHVLRIAREGGAKTVSFDSWRKGWDRRAKALGFRPRKWVKEV